MTAWISLIVFLTTTALVVVAYLMMNRDGRRAASRVRQLGEPAAAGRTGLDWLREQVARVPLSAAVAGLSKEREAALRQRFVQAGIYSPRAASMFLIARVLLTLAGVLLSFGAGLLNIVPPTWVLPSGLLTTGVAVLLPGLWLDSRITAWQTAIRRGLPDAMDMLVLALEGGASFGAAFQYVVSELKLAHPGLTGELEIVGREMLLGKSAGEAFQTFAGRCDLEDVRALAAVLLQNERYGVSAAKALRLHADTMRQQRQNRAEEMAQKAAVKILFPTLLCIFPAIFVVILGPAAFRIATIFARMR